MPEVDFSRAWLRMKETILEKRSHGQDELLLRMASLEIECELPEERAGFDTRPARVPRRVAESPAHEPPAKAGVS